MTMNRIQLSVLAAAMAAFAGVAHAEMKIASVRVDEVILQSDTFKAARDKFNGEFEKRKKDLESQIKQFQDDAKKYERDKDIMSPDERAKKEKDLTSRQVDLQYAQQKFNDDAGQRDREFQKELVGKLKDAIDAVAKEKGLDLIVRDPLYATPSTDITDEVLKRMQAATGTSASGGKKDKK
jgi:outer membrane protein